MILFCLLHFIESKKWIVFFVVVVFWFYFSYIYIPSDGLLLFDFFVEWVAGTNWCWCSVYRFLNWWTSAKQRWERNKEAFQEDLMVVREGHKMWVRPVTNGIWARAAHLLFSSVHLPRCLFFLEQASFLTLSHWPTNLRFLFHATKLRVEITALNK